MRNLKAVWILILIAGLSFKAQAQAGAQQDKLFSTYGLLKICLPDAVSPICWMNEQLEMIYNPVNGDFVIKIPAAGFQLDSSASDSYAQKIARALTQGDDFTFSGNFVPAKPIDVTMRGEYPVKLTGEISMNDTVVPAALKSTFLISEAARELKAENTFSPQSYQLEFFETYGLPVKRLRMNLFFQLRVNQ